MAHSPKRTPKNNLKKARELQGWTQKQLADILGVTQSMISDWERGIVLPQFHQRERLVEHLKMSIKELGLYSGSEEGIEQDNLSQGSIVREEKSALPSVHEQPPSYHKLSYPRDPFFTGRESILKEIHDKLNAGCAGLSVLAITGLAGVGKTHIAAEYAYRFKRDYQYLFWISVEAALQEIRHISQILDLPQRHESDTFLLVHAVKQWFQQNTNWLIIFDNVENMKELSNLLPQNCNGHILLTTLLPPTNFITQSVEIPSMNPEEGTAFLLRRTQCTTKEHGLDEARREHLREAGDIVEELGGLSLALDQAGAYIEEVLCTFGDYLDRYRSRRAEFLNRRGWSSTMHELSLATALSLTFEKVHEMNSAAVELLRLYAFLHAENIPEEMITQGAFLLEPPLRSVVADPHLFDEAIGALRRYSLVRRDMNEKTLSLHRLVQIILKEEITEKGGQISWAAYAVNVVSHILPPLDSTNWSRFQRYVAQAQSALSLIEDYQLRSPDAVRLLIWVGEYLGETGQNSKSEPLLLRALNLTSTLEPEHPLRQASVNALGILYFNQGRYQEAELLLQAVIEQNHEQVSLNRATSLNNLGELHWMQAQYTEAEPLFKKALEMRTHLLGPDDPVVAVSLCSLARLYVDQERYKEAKSYFEQSLRICEQTLDSHHITLADNFEGLADLSLKEHRPEDARAFYQKATEIYRTVQGPIHANFARCLKGLGETYLVQEQFEEAESLFLEVLAIYDQDEGQEYVDKAQVLMDLALVHMFHQERFMEAEAFLLEAVAIRNKLLGNHPYTAASYFALGRFYGFTGNYPKAQPYYQQALRIAVQTKGREDALVQQMRKEYAQLLQGMEEKFVYFTDDWFLSNLVGDIYRKHQSM